MKNEKHIGDLLLEKGLISNEQLGQATSIQERTKNRLDEVLVNEGFIEEEDLINVMTEQLGIVRVDFNAITINPGALNAIPYTLAKKHVALALNYDEKDGLVVAMSEPTDLIAIENLKLVTQREIVPCIASKREILNYIERFYNSSDSMRAIEEFNRSQETLNILQEESEDESIDHAPVVRIVNNILERGVRAGASDIHIEPFEDHVRLRMRVDGILVKLMDDLNVNTLQAIVSRIKVLAEMNIAEKRLPQDGAIIAHIDDRDIDLRISILPTIYGEKVAIRIFDKEQFNLNFTSLDFTEHELSLVRDVMGVPHGLILVTGPTGSGKSTTVYTILKELNKYKDNIVTVEDPVELKIDGINQVQVNQKTGLTFVEGLRSILRQDPDIIMIGEIRDSETARISIRASITGHLVLSTIHTNDAISTITRLIDMGIEPYLVSSSLVGIISQRLVRVLCGRCKKGTQASTEEKKFIGVPENEEVTLYHPVGCSACNYTGYRGRQGVHEVVKVNRELQEGILQGLSNDKLTTIAKHHGMISLAENAKKLVLNGVTAIDEVANIVFEQ